MLIEAIWAEVLQALNGCRIGELPVVSLSTQHSALSNSFFPRTLALIPLFALLVVLPGPIRPVPSGAAASVALPVTVESPNSQIKFDLSLRSENRAAYRVTLKGRPVVELSRLGILVDGGNLGDGANVAALERTRHVDRYRTRGVHSTAIDRYNAATIALIHQPS